MTSNEVRVYLTEAIARGLAAADGIRSTETMFEERWAEYLRRAEAVLAVVETLHTPCPNPECHYGIITRPIPATEHSRPQAYSKKCPTCGGSGQLALLAFDEMRGAEPHSYLRVNDNGGSERVHTLRFPVALSPDTTETP